MTIDRVAIIGAGPNGIVALNEFVHTGRDGRSTITSATSKLEDPKVRAFKEVVVFDRGSQVGGLWNYQKETDPGFPSEVQEYSSAPAFKEKGIEWDKGSVYDNLFTNVHIEQMRFSTGLDFGYDKDFFFPFASHESVSAYLHEYARRHDLNKYIRFNTSVEKVVKKDGKWEVSVYDGQKRYTESFDAVFIASGRMSIPFFPKIEGLAEFAKSHPDVIIHSKEFRRASDFGRKKVVLVGGGVSGVDILQYLIPLSNVILSTNTGTGENPSAFFPWMTEVLNDSALKLTRKPRIRRFSGNRVEFEDGTVETDVDKIIFATGYHTYFPFLDFPENEGRVGRVEAPSSGAPLSEPKDLYLFTFPPSDPTIAYTSLFIHPYFFITGEANAALVAGVWSGKSLPSKEEQEKWVEDHLATDDYNHSLSNEDILFDLFDQFYALAPEGRFEAYKLVKKGLYGETKNLLKDFFYKFASGDVPESTR